MVKCLKLNARVTYDRALTIAGRSESCCLGAGFIRACVVINLWIMTNYVIKYRNVLSYQTFVRSILHCGLACLI